jgi:hypothetical protein
MEPVAGGRTGLPQQKERIEIPAKWRIGQAVVIALIALLAIYYFTIGWHSPAGESGAEDSRNLFDAIGFLVLAGITWLTTPTAGVIAITTFHEGVRRRWMLAMLAFTLVMLALSTFFTWMQPGTEEQFIRDFGMGFIIIITLLMSIFLGVALVPPEIERRTIFTILSKPVNRVEFLIGKFLGLSLILLANLLIMGVMFAIAYALFRIRRDGGLAGAMAVSADHPGLKFELMNIWRAVLLQYGQLIVMSALALTLSLVISNITAIVFCFVIYFGGQMSSYWEHLTEGGAGDEHTGTMVSKPVQGVINVIYFILPRLDRFDVRERLVNNIPIAFNYTWKAFGSGLVYVAVLLTVSYLVFSDREF